MADKPAGYNPAFGTQKKFKWKVKKGGTTSIDTVAVATALNAPKVVTLLLAPFPPPSMSCRGTNLSQAQGNDFRFSAQHLRLQLYACAGQ